MTPPTFNADHSVMLTAGDVDHNGIPWPTDILQQSDEIAPGDASSQRAAVAMSRAFGMRSDGHVTDYRRTGALWKSRLPHQGPLPVRVLG